MLSGLLVHWPEETKAKRRCSELPGNLYSSLLQELPIWKLGSMKAMVKRPVLPPSLDPVLIHSSCWGPVCLCWFSIYAVPWKPFPQYLLPSTTRLSLWRATHLSIRLGASMWWIHGKTHGHMPIDSHHLPIKLSLLVWGKVSGNQPVNKGLSGLKEWCHKFSITVCYWPTGGVSVTAVTSLAMERNQVQDNNIGSLSQPFPEPYLWTYLCELIYFLIFKAILCMGLGWGKKDSYWEPVAISLINSIIIINGAKPAVQ